MKPVLGVLAGCASRPTRGEVPGTPLGNRRPSPTLADVLDAIDIQLLADSPEVVLIRDHAALPAELLHDICGAPTERR